MPHEQMEEVLISIHKQFVSLDREEVKKTRRLLKETLIKLTEYMSQEDDIFKLFFKEFYFGGSFYHNLKVKKPDEFNIELLLHLPKCEKCRSKNCPCIRISPSNVPGFLTFKLLENFCAPLYQKFCRNGGYMQTDLIFNWMKSLVYKALNRLKNEGSINNFSEDYMLRDPEVIFIKLKQLQPKSQFDNYQYAFVLCIMAAASKDYLFKVGELLITLYLEEDSSKISSVLFFGKYTECAPALKICVEGKFGAVYIDLAAAFKLDQSYWPGREAGYRQNPTDITYFSIVPKSPGKANSYWRTSFQAQEKEIINGKERLKPALRLLKVMRKNLIHKVSSYMLKTLILEEANKRDWRQQTLSHTFMIVLKKYIECLDNQHLPYFWAEGTNLLEGLKVDTLINHRNEITRLYNKIEREHDKNPTVIAEVIYDKRASLSNYIKITIDIFVVKKDSDDYKMFMESWNQVYANSSTLDPDEYVSDDDTHYSCPDNLNMGSIASNVAIAAVAAVGVGALAAFAFGAFSSSNRRRHPRE